MLAIGEEVNGGIATDDFSQTFADLALKETHDLAHSLQGKPLTTQLADDSYLGKILHGVEAAMALAFGLDDAALIPPLELAGGDAGQGDHVM